MNVVIIEDELPARERLTSLLAEVIPGASVVANLENVKKACAWFSENTAPDLVLLDVQLADGTAFDLLKLVKIDCPIIFTTAYSHYALEAFKQNSIDYLLKPVKKSDLETALQKLKDFRNLFAKPELLDSIRNAIKTTGYKKRFIIKIGDHIKTLPVEDISYFFSEHKNTFARIADGRSYPMDTNLDGLEELVDPQQFFRINRQYLINLKAIEEMKIYTKARVIVKLNPPVKEAPIVSSDRSADFKHWLAGDLS